MASQSKHARLAQWLQSVLQSGIVVDQTIEHYIETTFGTSDLAALLNAADNSETDSLLELLFYPQPELQVDFETCWADVQFTPADQTAILALLNRGSVTGAIHLPTGAAPIFIAVPDFVLTAFVQRLNITWQPHPRLAQTLNRYLSDRQRIAVRVHLRNASLAWHANQIDLLCLFLTRMPPDADDDHSCLRFVLSLLPELSATEPHDTFLIAKKFFYFQSLCNAEHFERQRLAGNMETLMLQGMRAAYGDIHQWRRHMQRIDRLCQTLFGRTRFFQRPIEHRVALTYTSDGPDMRKLTALLG